MPFFFPFENIKLNIGKLAIWRLQTHAAFGGTWLSDYVPNKLGGFLSRTEHEKPDCPLIGQNGNIFNLVGIASHTLKITIWPTPQRNAGQGIFQRQL